MTAPEWRDCADPDELAAAVAAGVEVLAMDPYGKTGPTCRRTAGAFLDAIRDGFTYTLPSSWTWRPEPPAPDDDLRERIKTELFEVMQGYRGYRVSKVAAAPRPVASWVDENLDDILALLTPTPPPVPPWPGAVLSGLTDEDGVPTWLAQAGQVRGEQVRGWRDMAWYRPDGHTSDAWVEVRAPRAVPEPETERVPWWKAKDRNGLAGDPFVEVGSDDEGPWVRVVEGGTKLHSPVAPDGTVEVLKDGGQ